MAQYGKQEYWDSRYQQDSDTFEWYQHWTGFKNVVEPYIDRSEQVLIIGCGNSQMSEELYDDGFKTQVNVDFSNVVIKQMQQKYQDRVGMQFRFMDIRSMDFPDGVFKAVLDKATIDAILCAEGSLMLAATCLAEVSRVLGADGVFVCISHGHPNLRLQVLEKPEYGWSVSVHTVAKPMLKLLKEHISALSGSDGVDGDEKVYHYVYVCQKGGFVSRN